MGTESKVAVITGASQGIGAALVEAYRGRNYRVVATVRSVKPTNDADVLVIPGDIADRKTAERAISEGVTRFGRIDTLVNNAGLFIAKPFTEYTEADYEAILGVNVAGFFHTTQLVIAEMAKRRIPQLRWLPGRQAFDSRRSGQRHHSGATVRRRLVGLLRGSYGACRPQDEDRSPDRPRHRRRSRTCA